MSSLKYVSSADVSKPLIIFWLTGLLRRNIYVDPPPLETRTATDQHASTACLYNAGIGRPTIFSPCLKQRGHTSYLATIDPGRGDPLHCASTLFQCPPMVLENGRPVYPCHDPHTFRLCHHDNLGMRGGTGPVSRQAGTAHWASATRCSCQTGKGW